MHFHYIKNKRIYQAKKEGKMAIRKEKNETYTVDVSFGSYNGKRIRIRKKGIEKRKDAIKIEAEIIKNHKNNIIKTYNSHIVPIDLLCI